MHFLRNGFLFFLAVFFAGVILQGSSTAGFEYSITSDPQLFRWSNATGKKGEYDEPDDLPMGKGCEKGLCGTEITAQNYSDYLSTHGSVRLAKVIRDRATQAGPGYAHVVIGDAVEDGFFSSWYFFNLLYLRRTGYPVYWGLGNHDLSHPLDQGQSGATPGGSFQWPCSVGDKAYQCAARSMVEKVRQIPNVLPGVKMDPQSLGYFWEQEGYRFIFLHLNPYSTWQLSGQPSVRGGVKWLVDNAPTNKRIILFVHIIDGCSGSPCDKGGKGDCSLGCAKSKDLRHWGRDLRKDEVFKGWLPTSSVVGIFRGHSHLPPHGYDKRSSDMISPVPVFNAGAAWYGSVLYGSFLPASYKVGLSCVGKDGAVTKKEDVTVKIKRENGKFVPQVEGQPSYQQCKNLF